ncbi:hypothetical protein EDB19DRAFT_1747728 [Suillus lakei]|nr:hypothetical protein EDB19DRAFT_1747728 [Suillus lakei]
MPVAMSTQLRELVTLSGLSRATVYNILQLYNDHGSLHNPLVLPTGRHRLLSANPTMFLDEIQDCLAETRNIEVYCHPFLYPSKSCNHTQDRKGTTRT